MASQPQARRRQWGKSRETGKVVIVENMDLGAPDRVDEGIGEKKRDGNGVKSSEKGLDLQHPEMLSNESLVRILTQYYVPIPAGTDDESNREKLMSLFRMHVQPRPQRQRRHHRKRDKSQGTPTQLITTSLSNMDWPNKEDETDVTSTWDCVATSLNRKRMMDSQDVSEELPASKKQLLTETEEVSLINKAHTTANEQDDAPITNNTTTKAKRILKRPGPSVSSNKVSKTMA